VEIRGEDLRALRASLEKAAAVACKVPGMVDPYTWIREVLMNPGARAQICSMTYPSRSI